MRSKKLLILSLLASSLALGCGGNGGDKDNGSGNDGGSGTVESGTSALNDALKGDGSTTSLTKAATAFDAAYRKSPTDGRAALGYGVSQAAVAAQGIADLFGASVSRSSARSLPLVGALNRLKPLSGLMAQVGGKNRMSVGALLPGFTLPVARGRAYPQSPTPAQVRAALASAAAQLDVVITRLASNSVVEGLESTPLTLSDDGRTVKLGRVEGYGFRSAVKVLRGLLDAALAYDFDYGTYSADTKFRAKFADRLTTNGATILATEYLPSGSFATLVSGGAARLADLRTQWTGVSDDGVAAIDAYSARSKGQDWLTDRAEDQPSASDLAEAKGALVNFKTALNNPLSTSIGSGDAKTTIVIDVPAFLSNPPADLRGLFPDLTVGYDPETPEFATLSSKTGSIEDPTFSGLVQAPGIPAAALYNPERTLSLASDDDVTTQGQVALFAFTFFTDDVPF